MTVAACLHGLASRPDVPPYPEDLGLASGPMDGGYAHVSNVSIPAGYTYFMQFVLHDLTFRAVPRLDLGPLYGDGPEGSPALYDREPYGRLREGAFLAEGALPDLPRGADGRALIADPRNDLTVMIGQIHAAFIAYHNQLLARQRRGTARDRFECTRREVTRFYHGLVRHDMLPRFISRHAIRRAGCKWQSAAYYQSLPAEFTLAAGRFGHAMVKPRYRLNSALDAPVFRASTDHGFERDLRGQPLSAEWAVRWENFFPTGHPMRVQASARLNARIPRPLFELPMPGLDHSPDRSIAYRTLRAGRDAGLPDGVSAAIALGCEPLSAGDIWDGLEDYLRAPAPLWFYILREADVQCHGARLGELGGTLVADVLVGALSVLPETDDEQGEERSDVGAWITSMAAAAHARNERDICLGSKFDGPSLVPDSMGYAEL